MNAKSALTLIRCHVGPGVQSQDPGIQKALLFAEKDGGLQHQLKAQMEIDGAVVDYIDRIEMPPEIEVQLAALDTRSGSGNGKWMGFLRQPPILALAIAVVVMLGWLIFYLVNSRDDFPGREDVLQMIATANTMKGSEFDVKSSQAGMLGDWLFSQYGFEDYYVPAELAHLKSIGCRVFHQDGFPVAQVAIEEHHTLCHVFHADDFGVKITPQDRWHVFHDDDWSAAIMAHGDMCVMVIFRGTEQEMLQFLAVQGR